MKCLVTGGAGFIGSHLCEKLIQEGHEVVALDNLMNSQLSNLEAFKDHPHFEFVKLDVRDRESCLALSHHQFDWIFHLAALADIVPSIENPDLYYDINAGGTFNILELAKKCEVKKFLYAASSSCYGLVQEFPTSEKAKISPEYPYALTKYLGEEMVMHWHKVYHLPALSLRLFNVYGPRSRTNGTYGAVFGVFLAQKLHGKPYTVVGDGSQTRDFTYVTDVANAFYQAALSDEEGKIYNIGSGNHYSINRLVELLQGDVVHIPKRPAEPDCTFADIKKIQSEIQWKPKVTFEQGVEQILKHKEYWKNAPVWDPESIEKATKSWFDCLEDSK